MEKVHNRNQCPSFQQQKSFKRHSKSPAVRSQVFIENLDQLRVSSRLKVPLLASSYQSGNLSPSPHPKPTQTRSHEKLFSNHIQRSTSKSPKEIFLLTESGQVKTETESEKIENKAAFGQQAESFRFPKSNREIDLNTNNGNSCRLRSLFPFPSPPSPHLKSHHSERKYWNLIKISITKISFIIFHEAKAKANFNVRA